MAGVEVAVRQPVPHTRDLPPRHLRLRGGGGGRQILDGLADLHQPRAYRVEDQTVAERVIYRSAGQMTVDCLTGDEDVMEATD